MELLKEFWHSLGPLGPCLLIFSMGLSMVLGFIFKWEWIYPSHALVRDYSTWVLRAFTLIGGIILMICSIIFYMFRDYYNWL